MSQDESAVNDQVVADATAAESAPVETVTTAPVADDDGLEAIKDIPLDPSERPDSSEEQDTEGEQPSADSTEETTTNERPRDENGRFLPKEQSEQSQNDATQPSPEDDWNSLQGKSQDRFRQIANDKRELQRQLAELQAQQAQFATEQDLVNEINPETGEYYTPQEIERISWQQSRETQAQQAQQRMYELQVQQNQLTINEEAGKVTQEIPMLNPESKDYVPGVGEKYAELLNDNLIYALPDGQQANRTTLLQNGINPDQQATLVGYSTSPYKLAKAIADSYETARKQGETLGQAKAQKASEKMLANADPSASVPSSGGDSLDSLFDRVKDIPLS